MKMTEKVQMLRKEEEQSTVKMNEALVVERSNRERERQDDVLLLFLYQADDRQASPLCAQPPRPAFTSRSPH